MLLQTSSTEALPGAAQKASSSVIWLDEEHHPQPAETGPAPHKGTHNTLLGWRHSVQSSIFLPLNNKPRSCPFFFSAGLRLNFCAFTFQKLQEQDERAEQMKGRLRWEQRELRVRLEQLQRGSERMRNDSQGSTMSSERSDSDRGTCPHALKLKVCSQLQFQSFRFRHIETNLMGTGTKKGRFSVSPNSL